MKDFLENARIFRKKIAFLENSWRLRICWKIISDLVPIQGFFSSPHCTASAKSSNYNVCIYDHRIDHIISSASQSSSSFIQWFLFRNKSILTGAFLMNVRSYTPAYWSWRWCDTVWTLISDLLCFHWVLCSW